MSKPRMQLLPFIQGSINLPHCSICPLPKQTRLQFPLMSASKSSCCFAMIHIDVWGPFHVPTHSGEKYFLTIVDDFSKTTWVYLMHFKVNVLQLTKSFFQFVRTQFSALVELFILIMPGISSIMNALPYLILWALYIKILVHILHNKMELLNASIDIYLALRFQSLYL